MNATLNPEQTNIIETPSFPSAGVYLTALARSQFANVAMRKEIAQTYPHPDDISPAEAEAFQAFLVSACNRYEVEGLLIKLRDAQESMFSAFFEFASQHASAEQMATFDKYKNNLFHPVTRARLTSTIIKYAGEQIVRDAAPKPNPKPVQRPRYIDVAETAKLLRGALKKAFPGVKFSVKSERYAGGASINVSWTDGPVQSDVDTVCYPYKAARFDGMIDLQTHVSHWLSPDGSIILAHSDGTEASMGCEPAQHNDAPSENAELVHFGSDYIFANRHYSVAFLQGVADTVSAEYGMPSPQVKGNDGGAWLNSSEGPRLDNSQYDTLNHEILRRADKIGA